jgi:hypothetical protein
MNMGEREALWKAVTFGPQGWVNPESKHACILTRILIKFRTCWRHMEKLGVRSDWPKDGRDSDYNYFHGHRSTVMNMNTNSVWKNRMGTFDFVRVVTLQINHCCVHHNDSINYASRLITYETSLNNSVAMWSAHSWTILVWLQFRSGLGFDLLSCAIVITQSVSQHLGYTVN